MTALPRPIVDLIGVFERLPGIGPKSATRLAFYLLNAPKHFVEEISNDLLEMKKSIKICNECFGVSENEVCEICSDNSRDKSLICVVERAIDVIAIENLGGYKGVYHVLGGTVNPLNHVGPEDLKINELIDKIENREVSEVILATNPTMEGEATALYINKKVESLKVESLKVTRIGSGLPMGADLEFADQATLSRAMEGRRTI
jgi:recombination protein RecR